VDNIEELLKQLVEASGIPGHEEEVHDIVRSHLQQFGEIGHDKLGSLICEKQGKAKEPRVMLVAHMDELGFMVSHITKEGFIKFVTLGGWWEHVLLAQRVAIKTRKSPVVGVIGAKPPHLLSDEERKRLVDKDNMYIDIGATSQEEVAEANVRIGDPVVPISEFIKLTSSRAYMAKAFDDRVGCATMISTLHRLADTSHPNAAFAVATVQEEVGLRGATTSVEMVSPHVAIVLEGTAANDVPGMAREGEATFRLGSGPIVTFYRDDMIPNLRLRDLVAETAQKHNIPMQARVGGIRGKTDGAVIHLYKSGVPTVVISLPLRHTHSHNGIIHRDDFDHTVELLTKTVQALDKNTVSNLTSW